MNRIWHHHKTWEDCAAGQYSVTYIDREAGVNAARELLRDDDNLWAAMSAVVREWPFSTEQNLSDTGRNRRAWLGQAACCFATGVPDFITKEAWHTLTPDEQDRANARADDVIAEWEGSDAQTLFGS